MKFHLLAPVSASIALGAGSLGRLLVHLFIWHLIWRFALGLWRIPTFGPIIVVVLVIALVTGAIYRSRRGRSRGGRYGYGTGGGPRDW